VSFKEEDLDLWQDGHDRGCDAEEQVDADEDLVLSAAIRVGVVHIEHDQSHQRQQVVDCSDRQQSCEDTTQLLLYVNFISIGLTV